MILYSLYGQKYYNRLLAVMRDIVLILFLTGSGFECTTLKTSIRREIIIITDYLAKKSK